MRNYLFTLLFAIVAISITSAQTFTPKSNAGGGFNVESGEATSATFTCEGLTFDVFETKKGSAYIKQTSSKGSVYPVWIHTPTSHKFEGKTVYVTKNDSYCVYRKGKSGNIYCQWLDKG